MNWYFEVLKKYAVFRGRARRMEYWMFFLINTIIALGFCMVEGVVGIATKSDQGILTMLYILSIMLPGIAVGVRRLHDIGRSGWWLLISVVPIIGGIILLVYMIQDSQPSGNQYGPNPKLSQAA